MDMSCKKLLVAAVVLLVSGALTASPAHKPVDSATTGVGSPPGELFDVGGFRLHINCVGHGRPTVLLDAGLGGFSLEWSAVQKALSSQTRVCSYDRAGYGWSDMGPLPRTTARISQELHELLHQAQLEPPFILVGHSFGGYSAQHFARQYSDEVAALVLVDSSHPGQVERLRQVEGKSRESRRHRRAFFISPQLRLHSNYPPEHTVLAQRLLSTWKAVMTIREESMAFELSATQVQRAGSLPDVPLVVLTRGSRVWPHTSQGDALEATWMELQDELALLTPDAVHLIAEHSGHSIHMDEPGIVISAVNTLLNRIEPGNIAGR